MYPQLKAHSALWEYFECDTFLEEKYSSTVTVNMLSQRLSMDLPNHARYNCQRIHNFRYKNKVGSNGNKAFYFPS